MSSLFYGNYLSNHFKKHLIYFLLILDGLLWRPFGRNLSGTIHGRGFMYRVRQVVVGNVCFNFNNAHVH